MVKELEEKVIEHYGRREFDLCKEKFDDLLSIENSISKEFIPIYEQIY